MDQLNGSHYFYSSQSLSAISIDHLDTGRQLGNIIVCDGVCVARVLGSNKIARGANEGVS